MTDIQRARPVSPPVSVRARLGKDPEPGVAARIYISMRLGEGEGGTLVATT